MEILIYFVFVLSCIIFGCVTGICLYLSHILQHFRLEEKKQYLESENYRLENKIAINEKFIKHLEERVVYYQNRINEIDKLTLEVTKKSKKENK